MTYYTIEGLEDGSTIPRLSEEVFEIGEQLYDNSAWSYSSSLAP